MINSQISTKELSRVLLYQFLTLAFYEPSPNLVEDLKKGDNYARLMDASENFLDLQTKKLMAEALDAIPGADEKEKDAFIDMKAEYTRLFIGPMTPACPPYESVFDKSRPEDWKGTMAGPTADEMAEALGAEGLGITLEYAELPDHVAIELEFMYYLLSRAYSDEQDAELYLEKANAFLVKHLSNWLPEFGIRVSQKSSHPFYQKAGLILETMINTDFKAINN